MPRSINHHSDQKLEELSIAHYSSQLSDPQLENVHHTIFNALEDYQTQSTQISTHEGQKAD